MSAVETLRIEALFVSDLQPSDDLDWMHAEAVAAATVFRFGEARIAELVAQEFGDHPEAARDRMRWAHQVAVAAYEPALR